MKEINFVWDEFWWKAELVLESWSGFQIRNGPYGSVSETGLSGGRISLVYGPEGRDDEPLREYEKEQVNWLINNEKEIHDSLVDALSRNYPKIREEFSQYFAADELSTYLPEIREPVEIKSIVGVVAMNVHNIRASKPVIGIELGCTWDEEHGLGVLLYGSNVLEIGQADLAFTLWMANKHSKKFV